MPADSSAAEILQRLLRVPPPQFVAERNRVARALKADGARDLATAVSALRRPGVSDWALDVTASEHPGEVAELVEAATEVIDAQEAAMNGRDPGDLRIRLKLLRVCTATVATLANAIATRSGQSGSGSSVMDITTRLSEISGNRAALDLLGRGLLGAEDPGVVDPFGVAVGVTTDATAERAARGPMGAERAPETRSVSDAALEMPTGPTADERRRRRAHLTAVKKALAAAESAADAAQRAVIKHERGLARAAERVTEAEAELEHRRTQLATATDELQAARDEFEVADRALSTARDALGEAERAAAE